MPTPRKHANAAQRQRAYRLRRQAACAAQTRANGLPLPAAISTMPSRARWSALRLKAAEVLQTLRNEMQGYYDERSEAWQESDKADAVQATIDLVEEAIDCVEAID